ncbi:glycoside hydrolase [Clostridium sp. chh4-2]|uniref:glycosyl hydrolase family 18 protein n=1 Tax=Clostridium sp. chh4-2 TaxID=2067550 RepID=UPI000CCEEB99|nr:glycosyl hydrolase family 18 protein [Clostridium sp. chh4-2]PNV61430.1 glycoside hydrolase [Clostridium sp. chh4-2]
MIIHTVQPGECLQEIANRYRIPLNRLIEDNGIRSLNHLVPGETLVILYPETVHTVLPGETVSSIARLYGVSVNQIYRNNPGLLETLFIYPGEQLIITVSRRYPENIEVGGYAYPYVNKRLLQSTLPFLSFFIPFTYEISELGELGRLNDIPAVSMAKQFHVRPVMNLSNLREPYGFNTELAHIILNNREVQDRVIEETFENILIKGYEGLDIDFEYVKEEDSLKLAGFIRRFRERLSPLGYPVFTALAAKTSSDQRGILFGGHDYNAVGSEADGVLLMTYEWGYCTGPPMPVAPIENVHRVLEYAVTQMPPDKIFLGIPNYGYDWPLPYKEKMTRAVSITNEQALELAWKYGRSIEYDNSAQTPFFQYTDGGVRHEVWFEDARSIQAKLELVAEYGLKGAGYWNLMRPFTQNWCLLDSLYKIRQ